jgi:hypothetical protein
MPTLLARKMGRPDLQRRRATSPGVAGGPRPRADLNRIRRCSRVVRRRPVILSTYVPPRRRCSVRAAGAPVVRAFEPARACPCATAARTSARVPPVTLGTMARRSLAIGRVAIARSEPAATGGEYSYGRPSSAAVRSCESQRLWRDPDSNRGHHDVQSCGGVTEFGRFAGGRAPAAPGRRRLGTRLGSATDAPGMHVGDLRAHQHQQEGTRS